MKHACQQAIHRQYVKDIRWQYHPLKPRKLQKLVVKEWSVVNNEECGCVGGGISEEWEDVNE